MHGKMTKSKRQKAIQSYLKIMHFFLLKAQKYPNQKTLFLKQISFFAHMLFLRLDTSLFFPKEIQEQLQIFYPYFSFTNKIKMNFFYLYKIYCFIKKIF